MAAGIIVAAGSGVRMGADARKQYLSVGGMPILAHTLMAFGKCHAIDAVYLVAPEQDFDFCRKEIIAPLNLVKEPLLVSGGTVRQESVYNGILAAGDDAEIAVIHDGVRPFISPDSIEECINAAKRGGACILGVPAFDTLKQTDSQGRITGTIDRSTIWLAQTPQAFQYNLIKEAHEKAVEEGFIGTDDASLVERLGKPVQIIHGSRNNIKITTPEDLPLAEAIFQANC